MIVHQNYCHKYNTTYYDNCYHIKFIMMIYIIKLSSQTTQDDSFILTMVVSIL